ncbi:MAG: hypothetical protein U0974_11390 [Gemmatimonadales bacterium]|nr:hypothetical protein [Gemmatimonadales bacterium]MDZ4390317.1 hypothetical protein [Gemmatimonadales bacterium]
MLDGFDKKVHVFDADGCHLLSFGGNASFHADTHYPLPRSP